MVVEEGQLKAASLFRQINERVKDLNVAFGVVIPVGDWLCECSSDTCVEKVAMLLDQYEAVRRHGTRFFVLPAEEHVFLDLERVVERHESYWVVEKHGVAATVATRDDPRVHEPLPLHT